MFNRGTTHFVNPLYNDEPKREANSAGNVNYAEADTIPYSEPKYEATTSMTGNYSESKNGNDNYNASSGSYSQPTYTLASGGDYMDVMTDEPSAVVVNPTYGSDSITAHGFSMRLDEGDHFEHKQLSTTERNTMYMEADGMKATGDEPTDQTLYIETDDLTDA